MKIRNRSIKFVLFDVGGVLTDSGDYLNNPALEQLCYKINIKLSEILLNFSATKHKTITKLSIEKCVKEARSYYKSVKSEYQPDVSIYIKNLLLEQLNYNPSIIEIDRLLNLFAEIEIRPFKPEAKVFIKKIAKAEIPWGIAANTMWPSNAIRLKVLEEFTQSLPSVLIWSSDIGYRKPNPLLITQACSCIHVAAENTLYIGNKKYPDMEASYRAGAKGVLVDPKLLDVLDAKYLLTKNELGLNYIIVSSLYNLESYLFRQN